MSQHTSLTCKATQLLLLFIVSGNPGVAGAADHPGQPSTLYSRCAEDLLDQGLAWGRIAWAYKCGYIEDSERDYMAGHERYPTFGNPGAGVSLDAPCFAADAKVTIIGDCKIKGCYPEDQQVMFNQSYLTLPEAYRRLEETVTSVGESAPRDGAGATSEQPIEAFVAGEEHGYIYSISAMNGMQLTVTARHPLIDASGEIVTAKAVEAGNTKLWTVLGPSLVVRVDVQPFDGMVWNVQPASSKVADNVLFAQGFLTGSVRFQNEWEHDESRLRVRVRDHVRLQDFSDEAPRSPGVDSE